MAAAERFDIEKVQIAFQNSLLDEDDILLSEYLSAYEEINRFFQLMGSVFSFVGSDIRSKIDVFREREKSTKSENFRTVKTMINYEKDSNLLRNSSHVSGSRTLLRLHRGLEFVYEFLYLMADLNECDKTHAPCKTAYNKTLAKYHSWMVRKGALVAMYTLPTQAELLKRVCVNVPRAIEMLPEMLKATKIVYDRVENLYTIFELHQLP